METEVAPIARTRSRHPNSWVFFDGEMVRYHDVHIGVMTHALHYGTGCFEGIRAYWNAAQGQLYVLEAEAHYSRLRRSAAILQLELPYTNAELIRWTAEILRRNDARTDTYIRPFVFVSAEEIGVRLHGMEQSFLIYTAPLGQYLASDGGIRCMVSTWRRISDGAIPARAKDQRLVRQLGPGQVRGARQWLRRGDHAEPRRPRQRGLGRKPLHAPRWRLQHAPVTEDILEGITRKQVIGLIRDELGLQVVERQIDRTELYTCDELLLCGTGAQVSPVIEVDHRAVGDGRVGRHTLQLQDLYFRAVRGEDPRYRDWLTPIYG